MRPMLSWAEGATEDRTLDLPDAFVCGLGYLPRRFLLTAAKMRIKLVFPREFTGKGMTNDL